MLNCKKGDLAIVVGARDPKSPNIGKIVRCLEFIPEGTPITNKSWTGAPAWKTDIPLYIYDPYGNRALINIATDEYLRPLRGDEGTDETLEWAGKPEEIHAC